MSRRTKKEIELAKDDATYYLLQTNNNPHKAWDLYIKEHLLNGTTFPYYVKGIKDFVSASEEMNIRLNHTNAKEEIKTIDYIDQIKEVITVEKIKSVLHPLFKTIKNNDQKISLVNLMNLAYAGEINAKDFTENDKRNLRDIKVVDLLSNETPEESPVNEAPVTESTNTPVTIPVQSIAFKWSESSLIADNTTVSTFTEANSLIYSVASNMYSHNEEGYRKTSFLITWTDGHTHEGRIDVTSSHMNKYNPIGEHVKNFYEGLAGLRKPSHWTEEQYKNHLLSIYKIDSEQMDEIKVMLNTYLFDDIKVSPIPDPEEDINSNSVTTVSEPSQPETFQLYSNTFNTYSDAYNHAIKHNITTSMILSSNANISNDQLINLESLYTTNKRNMSLQDVTTYLNHLITIPLTSDSKDRINALNRLIERHSNKQTAADKKEAETIELIYKFESLQNKLYSQ